VLLSASPLALAAETEIGTVSPEETAPTEDAAAPDEVASPGDSGPDAELVEDPPEELPEESAEIPPAELIEDTLTTQLQDPEPVLSVEVPATGHVIVNPYGLSVTLDGVESREQIVSGTYTMINYSEVPVTVSARATGCADWGSEAVLVPYPPAADTPQKEVFLFAEFQNAANGGMWSGVYTGAANQVPVDGFLYPDVLALEAGGSGLFRLFGAASGSPERMWRASDTVNVTLAFTFTSLYMPEFTEYEEIMP